MIANRNTIILILRLSMVFAILTGCGEKTPESAPAPTPQKVAPQPPKQVPAAGPSETAAKPELPRYTYEPAGRRDPFEPLLEIKKPVAPEGALTPLQKFDIAQLRLIGVIIGKGEPKAMVIAPDGKSYILKKGIKVGKNDGTVIEVNQDAVLVQERFIDFSGEVRTVVQEIGLPKREGVE